MKIDFKVHSYSKRDNSTQCFVQAVHVSTDECGLLDTAKSFCITLGIVNVQGEYQYSYTCANITSVTTRGYYTEPDIPMTDLTALDEEGLFQMSTAFDELNVDMFLVRKIQYIMQQCLYHKREIECDVTLN